MNNSAWQTIKIFISSTFSDMHSERDMIRKYVIPRLNDALAHLRVSVMATDLRWGVDTVSLGEEIREAKVLRVCMEAISNSRPYFVALIGDRYGWVPSGERIERFRQSVSEEERDRIPGGSSPRSVTEMEILLGALGKEERLEHSFFCFRSPDAYLAMDGDIKKLYVDRLSDSPGTAGNAEKLDRLKEHIAEACAECPHRIIRYSPEWDRDECRFKGLEDFAENLYQRLLEDIEERMARSGRTTVDATDTEDDAQRRYVAANAADFSGRKELIDSLADYLKSHRTAESLLTGDSAILLEGISGCGKSYIYSALCSRLESIAEETGIFPLYHSAGITPESVSLKNMIVRWCRILADALGDDRTENYTSSDTLATLVSRMQARGRFPVIVLDSLDSLAEPEKALEAIPFNVPAVATCIPGTVEVGKIRRRFGMVDVSMLGMVDAREMMDTVLRKNDKELPEEIRLAILAKGGDSPSYSSPLWLRMALTILMEIGSEDFRELNRITDLEDDRKINEYLMRTIAELPASADDLFRHFIVLSARYFNREIVTDSLTYIALSQYGIGEDLLASLIGDGWNQLEFESLRLWLRGFVVRTGAEGRWRLNHNILRNVLLRDAGKDYAGRYFEALSSRIMDDPSLADEFVFQVISNDATDSMATYIREYEPDNYSLAMSLRKAEDSLGQKAVLDFIRRFATRRPCDDMSWSELFIDMPVGDAARDKDDPLAVAADPYISLASDISDVISDDMLVDGEQDIIETYFHRKGFLAGLLREVDRDELAAKTALGIAGTYLGLKEILGAGFLYGMLQYDVFATWESLLRHRRRNATDMEEIYEMEDTYLDELEWFVDNIRHMHDRAETYERHTSGFFSRLAGYDRERLKHNAVRIHSFLLHLAPGEDASENRKESFIRTAQKMAKSYMSLFDSRNQPSPTPLTEALGIDCRIEEKQETPDFRPDPEPKNVGVVCNFGDIDDLPDDGEEWEEMEYVYEEEEDPFDLPEGTLDELDAKVDEMLRELPTQEMHGEEMFGRVAELLRYSLACAERHLEKGDEQGARNRTDAVEMLLVKFIFDLDRNFAISEYAADQLLTLGKWYEVHGQTERQTGLFESVCSSLWHSFYHHPDGTPQGQFLFTLLQLYKDQGRTRDAIALLEKAFRLSADHYRETCFDQYYMTYKSLGTVRPYFDNLLNAYKVAGDTSAAVRLLEEWLGLCDMAYTDNYDLGSGYSDYDEAYDKLGSLYDGTPKILEGMEQRGSRFLREPLILVRYDGKWGFIRHDGSQAVPCIYKWAWRAYGDVLSVSTDEGWGYIGFDGEQLTDFGFDAAPPLVNGRSWVMMNDSYALVTPGGFQPVDRLIDNAGRFFGDNLKVEIDGKANMLRPDGRTLLFDQSVYNVFATSDGSVIVTGGYDEDGDETADLWNGDGECLTRDAGLAEITPFGDNRLTPVREKENQQTGFIDRKGNIEVPFIYTYTRPFSEGMAAVALQDPDSISRVKWGFIDESGKEVIAPAYDEVGDFHDGLAWVCASSRADGYGFGFRGSKFGFVDRSGRLVVPIIYDDVVSFRNGVATVYNGDVPVRIDTAGNYI